MHVLIHHCINDTAAGEEAAAILLLIPHDYTILTAPENSILMQLSVQSLHFNSAAAAVMASVLLKGSPAEGGEMDPSATSLIAQMLMTQIAHVG